MRLAFVSKVGMKLAVVHEPWTMVNVAMERRPTRRFALMSKRHWFRARVMESWCDGYVGP